MRKDILDELEDIIDQSKDGSNEVNFWKCIDKLSTIRRKKLGETTYKSEPFEYILWSINKGFNEYSWIFLTPHVKKFIHEERTLQNKRISKKVKKYTKAKQELNAKNAYHADSIGYLPRSLVLTALPLKNIKKNSYLARNGNITLSMICPEDTTLPYGAIPRLILAYISSQVIKNKNNKEKENKQRIFLGNTLSEFLSELGIDDTSGGSSGSITRVRYQMERLLSTSIQIQYKDKDRTRGRKLDFITDYDIFWKPINPDQMNLIPNYIDISESFYSEILDTPVPLDIRVLKQLTQDPMAIDLYMYFNYKLYNRKKEETERWDNILPVFASNIKNTKDAKKIFRQKARKIMSLVEVFNSCIDFNREGVILKSPAIDHIPTKKRKPVDNPVS